ncbi:MAG: DNA mismatch repair endonuclease MutL [Promethearchaeota archaeon]
MSQIVVLSEETINKISAGEVIERPAAVVKELVENAIDAGATKIIVKIQEGGKKSIYVSDNGVGMLREDAELALLRYTTSKIRNAKDLTNISTLGFRGEALASICAVSRLELVTRTKNQTTGIKIIAEGGIVKEKSEVASPIGTMIFVRDLFYNTPARKKFLKIAPTEFNHIFNVIRYNALSFHEIYFQLTHNEREVLTTPSNTLLGRIIDIYGKNIAEEMISVNYSTEDIKIAGYISSPNLTRGDTSYQSIFVNSRYIKDSRLTKNIENSYGQLLEKRRHPIIILNLEINPKEIDVNVHPTKREIRFSKEKLVLETLKTSILEALTEKDHIPSVEIREESFLRTTTHPDNLIEDIISQDISKSEDTAKTTMSKPEITSITPPLRYFDPSAESVPHLRKDFTIEKLGNLVLLGQAHFTYLIFQDKEGLILVDQHAADERVQLEKITKKYMNSIDTQNLLAPIKIELKQHESELLKNNLDTLNEYGLNIEHFGGTTFVIRSLPIGPVDVKEIREMVEELLSSGELENKETLKETIIKLMACHSAIRAGEKLSVDTSLSLIRNLFQTENPYTCAHGRPTMIRISNKQLEKLFKRIA